MQGLAREGSRVQRCPRWPLELAVSWRQSRVVCLLSAFLLPESRVSLAPQWPPDTTPPRGSGLVPASGSLRPQPCPHAGGPPSGLPCRCHLRAIGVPQRHCSCGPSKLLTPQRKEAHGRGGADNSHPQTPIGLWGLRLELLLSFLSDLFLFFIIEHCLHFY